MHHFRIATFTPFVLLTLGCASLRKTSIKKVDKELSIVENKMKTSPNISFIQYKHVYNEGANYKVRDTMSMFHSFDTLNKILPKFQVQSTSSKSTFIFNGTDFFSLQNDKKTYTNISDPKKAFTNSAYLFRQSWANILSILPTVINSKVVIKKGKDTLIDNKVFYVVNFCYPTKKFNPLSGLTDLETDTIKWNYELIINKSTHLPTQFNMYIQTKSIKTPNYIKVTFNNINTRPDFPNERSWFFSTYAKDYTIYSGNEKRVPLITIGKSFPEWKLPLFDPHSNNTSNILILSSQYKGDIVLYAFWIKNCGYSQDALPYFSRIQKKFGGGKFHLISINCEDSKDQIDFFYKKLSPNYPMLYNGKILSEKLGIYGYPIFVLVDKNNTIVKVYEGLDYEKIAHSIQETLAIE